jgi:predicted membrane-bound spermidine synthase
MISELAKWDSFYVIVGSAAGALVGLQFVVLTLVAQRPRAAEAADAGGAFATPNVVHFSSVLLLAALSRAPWETLVIPAALWGLVGLGGVVYTIIIARRMTQQSVYKPQFEDWLFHAALPFVAYLLLVVSPLATLSHTHEIAFVGAGATLLLLFIGIHNAWDAIAYHVFGKLPNKREQ